MSSRRYLITTADERTWKFDRPVLFLGEWCRLYHRRGVWRDMDACVAAPYGLEANQQDRDLAFVIALAERLLPELVEALNAAHETKHSLRYWHIVVGYWLQHAVSILFNRYATLERALADYDISGTSVVETTPFGTVTPDALGFMESCDVQAFNQLLYASVLNFFEIQPSEKIVDNATSRVAGNATERLAKPGRTSLKRALLSGLRKLSPFLSRSDDALLLNTYLPPSKEAALQLAFGQWPQYWERQPTPHASVSVEMRSWLHLGRSNQTGFETYVRRQIPMLLPACYLEGYRQLIEQASELKWPNRPRFIFTSNNFSTDEVFKVWTAGRVECGVPYFVGQHGNNYGTLKGSLHWPEVVTPDRFLTWGWRTTDSRITPAFAFTIAGRKVRTKGDGGLLLVEQPLHNFRTPWDCYFQFCVYQEEQFRFVEALPASIKACVTVRLHGDYKQKEWAEDSRWHDRCPDVRLECGTARMRTLVSQSRLVVFSYDSTGILEGLGTNSPTIAFWNGGLDHLMPGPRSYYDILRDVGILHDSPETAAIAVAHCWDDIAGWWNQPRLQDARRTFCDTYAKVVPHPVLNLKRLLVSAANRNGFGRVDSSRPKE